ncbi:coiled-coil domain-containing protein 81-like isoform X1 [Patiria miniata]|uniref:Coiled-coil domain-containing protein 81 n=1 Tax=Patiria miniata TaxID=46514 RepID=A0A914BKW8_PATMI|nr:coiled-coil domain-containing protein 81-like isoform X1 [Patiria miniata]
MTEVLQELVSDARKHRFSTIPNVTDDDVVSVWANVASFVERHMHMQKGVNIPGLGTFTFTQKKLDIGNNKFILIQRPVFSLSEKFAQTHRLDYAKHFTSGQIPIVQLNFSVLSAESPFDRDTVERCVKEVLLSLSRSVQSNRNVEFTFSGIGRLAIRDGKVKMKFYKDFLNMMDGSGTLAEALKNRPDTADSVMSRASTYRPLTGNTLVLPRISQGSGRDGLALENEEPTRRMPTIDENQVAANKGEELREQEEENEEINMDEEEARNEEEAEDTDEPVIEKKVLAFRTPSRQVAPTAKATGISLIDDLTIPTPPRGIKGSSVTPSPPNGKGELLSPPRSPKSRSPEKQATFAGVVETREYTPPGTSCGHRAGQELCYLCHQRAVRNVPVSFEAERRRKEQEQDRLLQQYQHLKDTEAIINEQAQNLGNRHHSQKIAAFNLGVSEAIKNKKKERPTEFHRSYVFQRRCLTPPRHIKQEEYAEQLAGQVEAKATNKISRNHDQEFLERLEQVQLAEELAAQREQYLRDKAAQTDMYQRALSAQIHIRDRLAKAAELANQDQLGYIDGSREGSPSQRGFISPRLLGPLSLPVPKIILPFSKTEPLRLKLPDQRTVRFKPLPLPAAVPDSKEPIFGKNDATNEQLADKRRRAIEVYKEQLSAVEQTRRQKLLSHLRTQREEMDILDRTRRELVADRANRFNDSVVTRKSLEDTWKDAASLKRQREEELRLRAQSPGILMHEQCEDYHRCEQCKRRLKNCGESNIWSESRYIPGSRLMV